MKKLVITAALLGLTFSSQATEIVPFTASCKTPAENTEFLEQRYNELPIAGGPSVIRTVDGKFVSGSTKIFVDPKNKGFTILIEFENINKSCVLLMGDDFAPILTGNPT